jgi:putative DNA primase/helicase
MPLIQDKTSRYVLLNGVAIKSLPSLQWCVKDVLPAQGLAVIYGASGSGKSFLALDMACAIAEGRRWFGYRVEQRPVVYLCLEGQAGFRLRIAAWEQANARPLPGQLQFLFDDFKLSAEEDVQALAEVAPANTVFLIDTLNRAAPTIDENSSKDMGSILDLCKYLQRLTNGLVMLVHHTGKNASAGIRGHSSLLGAADAAIDVSRENDMRNWQTVKIKDGVDGRQHSFRLVTYCVGTDIYGENQESCVIVEDTSKSDIKALVMPTGVNQKAAMTAIANRLSQMPPSETGLPRISLPDAIAVVAECLDCEKSRRNTEAKNLITALNQKGLLAIQNGMVWDLRR